MSKTKNRNLHTHMPPYNKENQEQNKNTLKNILENKSKHTSKK